jgi:cobalamin biosynthesis protein CbiD
MKLVLALASILAATSVKADTELDLLSACAGWSEANFKLMVADRYFQRLEEDLEAMRSDIASAEMKHVAENILRAMKQRREDLGLLDFDTGFKKDVCSTTP